jgi:predicted DNA binding CopG/RHH family protein
MCPPIPGDQFAGGRYSSIHFDVNKERAKLGLHIYAKSDTFLCMRTTIEISNELLRQAKKRAADEGAPLRKVIEEALRFYLGRRLKNKRYELKWRTERGRILPGVRLDDRDALFDLMEGRT